MIQLEKHNLSEVLHGFIIMVTFRATFVMNNGVIQLHIFSKSDVFICDVKCSGGI